MACEGCFEKMKKIDELGAEIKRLRSKLGYREKQLQRGYFGLSTPSSKIPVKKNTDNKNKKSGAKKGHKGYGRKVFNEEESDKIIEIEVPDKYCDKCDDILLQKRGSTNRTVMDIDPVELKKILYKLEIKVCSKCGKVFMGKAPGVLPQSLYGNQFLTHIIIQHYLYGVPLGRILKTFNDDVPLGSIINQFHNLSKIFEGTVEKFEEEYRKSDVKHADETGWRTEGQRGYAWLFCNKNTSIFKFENTRSSKIPLKVFGEDKLPGVLVVDRYNGYNKVPCDIQYCYAHILRDIKKIEDEFYDNEEVIKFVDALSPLIKDAIRLRKEVKTNKVFKEKAGKLKNKIIKITETPSEHPGIRYIQDIFIENHRRMFHWAKNRKIPADNNFAEREIRPTVIARKVSFGSQSIIGAKTRSVLMSTIHTLNKRVSKAIVPEGDSVQTALKNILDKIAETPAIDPYSLFPKPS